MENENFKLECSESLKSISQKIFKEYLSKKSIELSKHMV